MAVRKKNAPLQKRVKELLTYCPITGIFRYAKARRGCGLGKVAGWSKGNGHIGICIDGEDYIASRVAWLYMTGNWPDEIDHKNLNPSDNSWDNLRECSHNENLLNRRMPKTNKCGLKGVQEHSQTGKFRARLRANGKKVFDGLFGTPQEAHAAYIAACKRFHGEFGRTQ